MVKNIKNKRMFSGGMSMVSVIISTCKRAPEILERALKSVLAQTYKEIEIIVVDDSPATYVRRNDIKNLILKYGNSVMYIQHKKNSGACAARNTGLKHARGEYVAFLDDDDEWVSTKIQKQVEKMERCSEDTALIYCGNSIVNDLSGEETIAKKKYYRGYAFSELIKQNFIGSTSYPLIKTQVLREIGGFDEKMPAAQDFDVWLRIAIKYQIDYVAENLVKYHIHGDECISKNPQKKIAALQRINEKYAEYLDEHRYAKWNRYVCLVFQYSLKGEYWNAIKYWKITLLLQPLRIQSNIRNFCIALKYAVLKK